MESFSHFEVVALLTNLDTDLADIFLGFVWSFCRRRRLVRRRLPYPLAFASRASAPMLLLPLPRSRNAPSLDRRLLQKLLKIG